MTQETIGQDDDTGQVQNPDARVDPAKTAEQQDAARELVTALERAKQAVAEVTAAIARADEVGLDVQAVLESAQPKLTTVPDSEVVNVPSA